MRGTNWTPSIIPSGNDQTVYLLAEDFGKLGRAWQEADYEATDLEILSGQYNNPIRVVAFNTAERWSEDVSEDAPASCDDAAIWSCGISRLPSPILWKRHEGAVWRQLTLRLV